MSEPIKLPECGMFFGVPVYIDRGGYIFQTSGLFYTSWVADDHDPLWYIDKAIEDNQGNLVIIWDSATTKRILKAMSSWLALEDLGYDAPDPDWENGRNLIPEDYPPIAEHMAERYGAGFYKFVKTATDKGLYVYSIYSNANPEWTEKIVNTPGFLGYNAGEAFSFNLETENAESDRSGDDDLQEKRLRLGKGINLAVVADSFRKNIQDYFKVRRENGWDRFFVTSGSFHLDFEIASGGNDIIPHVEGFAFHHLNFGMALCRGLYKQCGLPLWGCYLAHEHYAFVPYASPLRKMSLDSSNYLAYLNGSKITVQESGSWWQQSDHVEDTPMHNVPKFETKSIHENDPYAYRHLVKEARKHYPKIGYDSAECKMYRKSISDFYDYLKANGTPEGQPEVNIAALKGRFDFCSQTFAPNGAIANAFKQAERDPRWYESQPERSWEIFRKVFFPLNNGYGDYKNLYFSGTPYGMADVVSFAAPMTPEFLLKNYKALLFTGWNSAEDSQYEILKEYVKGGGILFAAIPHFSKNITRDYVAYGVDELINGGDLSELCGVKVMKRDIQFYWALMRENNTLGLPKFKRFGAFYTHLGELEIGSDVHVEAIQDEVFKPLLLSRKYGKGQVYFLNSWEYPGAYDGDWAPGSLRSSPGFVGEIYKSIASRCRGTAYITDDGVNTGANCNDITYSYFPSNGKIYLMNCNFSERRSFFLHFRGKQEKMTLQPGEFKVYS